jgi:branched-chain amino acid transport system permease protein
MRPLATAALLGAALTAPAWVWNPYHLHTLIMAGIFAVLALSLNLLLGYTGQLSLGHAAFFGIGAYASALLTVKLEWSPWPGLLVATAAPAAAGFVIGRLALKLRGAYFVLLTISFAGVISLISVNWTELTNGPPGLPDVPPLEVALPGLPALSLRAKSAYYYLVLGAVVAAYLPGPWSRSGRTRRSPSRWGSTARTTSCSPR